MSLGYSIKECLHGYTSTALGVICQRWGLAATTKPARIRAIEKVLQDPLHIEQGIRGLEAPALRLLHLVAARGNAGLDEILGVPGLFANGKAAAVLQDVAQQGLLLVCPSNRSGAFSFAHLRAARAGAGTSAPLAVPDPVVRRLPPAPPLGVQLKAVSPPDSPDAPAEPDRLTAAFLEGLRVVDVLGPRVTAAGALHKADLSRARDLASGAGVSADELGLALMMARELGCVRVREGRLTTTPKGGQWVTRPPADRIRSLFEAYLRSEDIPDLELFFPQLLDALDEHLPRNTLRRTYHRALVAEVLREQRGDAWYSIDGLVAAIQRADRNFLFLEEGWRAIRAHVQQATGPWKERSWRTHEERLLKWMIQNLLSSAGMVELGCGGRVFRITDLGRYALGVGAPPADKGTLCSDALVVKPDFEVVAYLDRCPADVRWRLDSFCERIGGGDRVCTYRLTMESVYRGVRAGSSTTHLIQLLESCSSRALPENVAIQLAAWQRKAEAITIRTDCRLLECGDARQAARLAASYPGSRRIGTRFVLLAAGAHDGDGPAGVCAAADAVVDYSQPQRACLIQETGLRLRAPWLECGLLLRRRMEDVGEVDAKPGKDLVVRLVPGKVQRTRDWPLLVAQLEAFAKYPLAVRYRTALRAWSGDVGPARSATATLVRFDDPEACEAAMQLPGADGLVEGRLGLYTLVIRQGRLAQFKRGLREHGVRVERAERAETDGPPEQWAVEWVRQREASEEPEPRPAGDAAREPAEPPDTNGYTLPSYSPRIVCEILEDAIERRRTTLIQYQSPWSPEPSLRKVNPVSLDVYGPSPSLSGYCHQHRAARTFKLARICGIRLLEDEPF
ncbi:MAG: helicase-associated domain-containing protein [Candidatus Hydrogenedentes bacterium]|nr:helicase-associated domain-containing protein [Candidatus Hydrogenedentota bacterium]